ncbi:helix-turn-helix domain-containing protein [Paenibacillus sp. LMG 31460]|uniref:Helix-turn-helix domain-containing protein n=1 Tax=Paenibacillus germinis TaxID=2654979 RepID=A0ABX1YZM9_9BACL|nr:helix-turn-helix domain-containing protein [Paenibacillus germinis]NOU85614.1 helix-turn-helix domain-containing protein [Paenibacillus germinis]
MRKLNLNYYYKNLIIVFIVTCLPMAIIAACNYFIAVKQIETEVKRNHQLQLQQIYNSMEKQLSHLELIGNQWGFNPIFNSDLLNGDLRQKPDTTRELLVSLRILKETNPLIDNAVLYLQKDQLLISDDEGINSITEEPTKQTFQQLLTMKSSLFWWDHPISALKYKNKVNVALVHKVQGLEGAPFGTIILYINKSQLDDWLFPLNPDGEGVAFILNKDGEWVTNGRRQSSEPIELDEAVRQEVLKQGRQEGDFIYNQNGVSYSVTIGLLSRNGWKYVVATPLSKLTAPVILVSKLGLAISLIGLLVAFVLSLLASRSIYRPVKHLVGMFMDSVGGGTAPVEKNDEFQFIEGKWRKMIHESRELHVNLEQSRQSLKEGLLLQLIQGHLYFFSEAELKEKMSLHGWNGDDKGFAIILVRMDGIADKKGKFHEGDEQLATFSAVNISQEILKSSCKDAEVINFYDLSFAVLLAYPSELPKEQVKSDLFRLSGELIDILTRFTQMRFTVGVGKLVYLAQDIHKSLEEAREALRFRDLDKNEQILDMDNILPLAANHVNYPFDIENAIIQSMKMGVQKEAVRQLEYFVEDLKQNQGKEMLFQQGMLQLLGSILHALLKSGVYSAALHRDGNLFEQLSAIKVPDEMLRWMRSRIIEPYVTELSNTREKIMKQIVNKVIDAIHEHYHTPISLESCADAHGITSYNLSKEFKQYTGTNFIDYLTNIRLEKAKELLRTTDMKMNDIAERVGYQPTYFIRIFKKVEGTTPGRYREMKVTHFPVDP